MICSSVNLLFFIVRLLVTLSYQLREPMGSRSIWLDRTQAIAYTHTKEVVVFGVGGRPSPDGGSLR